MLSDSQVQDYLARIGFQGDPQVNKETLNELILRHQMSVPFETVSIHRSGETPSCDSQDVFDKVVNKRLGGYCFELNKGFEDLLRAIGFDAKPCMCRAVRGRDVRMPINHRGMMVFLDEGVFSADVGFGGPMPAGALLLEDGVEQEIAGETYIAIKRDENWWDIDRITKSGADLYDDEVPIRRQTELSLCTAEIEELDFAALNHFCSLPGTLFRDHEVVNLRALGGYYGLKDNVLTKRIDGNKEVVELEDAEAVDKVLADIFGMVM